MQPSRTFLLLVAAVTLAAVVVDAQMMTHRRTVGAPVVHSYYYFPAACPAVAAAGFAACGHAVPAGFAGALHQGTAFVSYAGCPHAHYVVGVGQVHPVRFRAGKDEDDSGPTKDLALNQISCDGNSIVNVTQSKDVFEFDAGKCNEKAVKDVLGKFATVESSAGGKYKVKLAKL